VVGVWEPLWASGDGGLYERGVGEADEAAVNQRAPLARMNDTDARLGHPWLRVNRVLRVMLHTRWSAEAWAEVRVEFRKALALRSEIRRAGLFT
jgi:hypothetical protein